jgi:uncharacterized damage-inducible protein DinB
MSIARQQLLDELDRLGDGDWSRYVPYGDRTLRDLLAHLAAADQAWAIEAQGLLKSEGASGRAPLNPEERRQVRANGIERGRRQSVPQLRAEMERRRKLLLSLYELLEPKHLSAALPSFGETHNSVRERIWRGYHDRMHAADVQRALRLTWHPQELRYLPEIAPIAQALSPDDTLYVVYNVDPVYWERRVPGSEWTYRGLLAHLATGDWVFQRNLRSIIETGTRQDVDVDAGNAERIEERKHSTDRALTEEYLSMRHETLRLLSSLAEEHLRTLRSITFDGPDGGTVTMLDRMHMFPGHDRAHRDQLRPAMKHATATAGAP